VHDTPPYTSILTHTNLGGFLSEAHTSGGVSSVCLPCVFRRDATRLCTSPLWCLLVLLAVRQGTSQQ
jgi:hypothetical protein